MKLFTKNNCLNKQFDCIATVRKHNTIFFKNVHVLKYNPLYNILFLVTSEENFTVENALA